VEDTYFEDWRESQKKYMEKAEEYFSPVPTFHVNLFKDEILGYESLKAFARQIYGKRNPLERFFEGEPYSLTKENGEYQLTMKLPFIRKGDVELNKVSDELIVRVGSFKRHLLLPRHVAAAKEVKARLEGEYLYIHFKGEDHGKAEG
ncbi:MAG: ArsA family ATPase, partial [Desulfobacteraceae bacterium]|nr:ArsA family ATPase [Desulfobacteraceae bacterium]